MIIINVEIYNMVKNTVKIFDNIVDKIRRILLFCHNMIDHIASSHGEGW